jgi:hypothetical protein
VKGVHVVKDGGDGGDGEGGEGGRGGGEPSIRLWSARQVNAKPKP